MAWFKFSKEVDAGALLVALGMFASACIGYADLKRDVSENAEATAGAVGAVNSLQTQVHVLERTTDGDRASAVSMRSDLSKVEARLGVIEQSTNTIPTIVERVDWILRAVERQERRSGYTPPPTP